MIELGIISLTIGAVLFYIGGVSLMGIGIVSLFFGVGFFFYFPSKRGMVVGVILGCVCFVGALTVWSRDSDTPNEVFGERTFLATVRATNRELDRSVFIVRDDTFDTRIQITFHGASAVLPGDRVEVKGIVEPPEDFVTDTGRLFHYEAYLESKNIRALSYDPAVTIVKEGALGITRFATIIRYAIADVFTRHLSFPTDGIVSGMLVGYQGGIPKSIEDLFRTTGILHVLVLSGYNITILAGSVGLLLRSVPQRIRIGVTFASIALLVLVSGSGVASLRAGIMGALSLFAIATLQPYNVLRALFVSYLLFFLWNPLILFSDPGFHLSFLATLCMIVVIPKIEPLFSFIPKIRRIGLREILMLAVFMPIFMLPYTMYFSGLAPFAAIPANILLALLIPLIMVLGVCVLFLSFVAPLGGVAGIVLSYIGEKLVYLLKIFDQLPKYNTPTISGWGVVGIYGMFFVFLFRKELQIFISRLRRKLLPQTNSSEQ